jgi:serine/threonine protein phosphatase PrpC
MHVTDQRIKEILGKNKKAKNGVNILMKEALVKGGEDNISAICIFT